MIEAWAIPGSAGETIFGNCHMPRKVTPRAVMIIAHGFKGYKDYGMFPRIADTCADAGFVAHRFNFSHSGMTNRIETFERPDLFERDTWNRQVFDLRCVIEAVSRGELTGQGLPYVLFGHSRGGVTALLTAGRYADDPSFPQPAGVITVAAPAQCNPLSTEESRQLLEAGFLESPSSRTGQRLRLGSAFLQEQLDDPLGHDLLMQVRRIRCPILIAHGTNDPTVPVQSATLLKSEGGFNSQLTLIEGGDHVFNTPNPGSPEAAPSPQLKALTDQMIEFAEKLCPHPSASSASRSGPR